MFGLSQTGAQIEKERLSSNTEESSPWIAASEGNLPLLQALMQNHSVSSINVKDEYGYTLVHAAASYNQIHILNWIVSKINVEATEKHQLLDVINVKDNDGDTPLHHCEDIEAAKFLVENGARIHERNRESLTAIDVKENELEEMTNDEDMIEDEQVRKTKALLNYLRSIDHDSHMSED